MKDAKKPEAPKAPEAKPPEAPKAPEAKPGEQRTEKLDAGPKFGPRGEVLPAKYRTDGGVIREDF